MALRCRAKIGAAVQRPVLSSRLALTSGPVSPPESCRARSSADRSQHLQPWPYPASQGRAASSRQLWGFLSCRLPLNPSSSALMVSEAQLPDSLVFFLMTSLLTWRLPTALVSTYQAGGWASGDSAPLSCLSLGCQLPARAPLNFGFIVSLSGH